MDHFCIHDEKICLDPWRHKPPSFGQPSSLHLVLTEIKSKIENTGIAPTVLELNMYSLPKSQPCMHYNKNSYRYSSRNYKDSYTCKPGWAVKVCSQTSCAFSHLGDKMIKLVKSININTLKFESRLHLIWSNTCQTIWYDIINSTAGLYY